MADGQLLVVDDEQAVTELLDEHLRACGYDVAVAHDGGQALIMAAARRPDAVLLDITMPGPDGTEVLARLRAIDPTVSIVMLTGNTDEALARQMLRGGAFDYVPKPFRLDVLERVIAAAVAAGRRS